MEGTRRLIEHGEKKLSFLQFTLPGLRRCISHIAQLHHTASLKLPYGRRRSGKFPSVSWSSLLGHEQPWAAIVALSFLYFSPPFILMLLIVVVVRHTSKARYVTCQAVPSFINSNARTNYPKPPTQCPTHSESHISSPTKLFIGSYSVV